MGQGALKVVVVGVVFGGGAGCACVQTAIATFANIRVTLHGKMLVQNVMCVCLEAERKTDSVSGIQLIYKTAGHFIFPKEYTHCVPTL